MRIDPAFLANAERLRLRHAAHDERRTHVDHHVGVHVLGVGEADLAIAGRGGADLLGGHVLAHPGVGVVLRHVVEARPQAGYPLDVFAQGFAARVANGVVVHRIDLNGLADALGHFELVMLGLLRCADDEVVGARRLRLRKLPPGLACLVRTVAVLGAGDEHEVRATGENVVRSAIHDGLILVAPDQGADRFRPHRTDAFGDGPRRIFVAPDPPRYTHRPHLGQEVANPSVAFRQGHRPQHHLQGLERLVQIVDAIKKLADPDQHWRVGIAHGKPRLFDATKLPDIAPAATLQTYDGVASRATSNARGVVMETVQNKVAVVTGAASGIGLGMTRALAGAGAHVAMLDVEGDALAKSHAEFDTANVDVRRYRCDVSNLAQVEEVASRVRDDFGGVHIVCNNAGVGAGGPIDEATQQDWQWVLGVNLYGRRPRNAGICADHQGNRAGRRRRPHRQHRLGHGDVDPSRRLGVFGVEVRCGGHLRGHPRGTRPVPHRRLGAMPLHCRHPHPPVWAQPPSGVRRSPATRRRGRRAPGGGNGEAVLPRHQHRRHRRTRAARHPPQQGLHLHPREHRGAHQGPLRPHRRRFRRHGAYARSLEWSSSRSCERARARRPAVRASELPTRPSGHASTPPRRSRCGGQPC
ncbi:MAG: SDR family NAD(P)-dependent oxidoreductase [Gammaproteobacteria bacterium]|nr:SDR family NAD(P)-dependent oxidoreductase [Gammaproteobacteria bacterium]